MDKKKEKYCITCVIYPAGSHRTGRTTGRIRGAAVGCTKGSLLKRLETKAGVGFTGRSTTCHRGITASRQTPNTQRWRADLQRNS